MTTPAPTVSTDFPWVKWVRYAGISLCFVGLVVLAWKMLPDWSSSTSTAAVHTSTATAAARAPDPCDNQYRKYPLTKTPERIVTAQGCQMGWDILQGSVVLIGPGGVESRPITNSTPLPDFHGVKWRSHGPTALVEARFYR